MVVVNSVWGGGSPTPFLYTNLAYIWQKSDGHVGTLMYINGHKKCTKNRKSLETD